MRPYYFDFEKYRSRPERSSCHELIELLRDVVALPRQWLRRDRERSELARLDHTMQRDIGVTPSEMARECRKPFWRA
jgi:uncharacterized protein YjiS (DUF1127 family)